MANSNNNNDFGSKITHSLAEGLKTGDFSGLNDAISDSVDSALKEAGKAISDSVSRKNYTSYGGTTAEYNERIKKEREARNAMRREREARNAELRRQRDAEARARMAARKAGVSARDNALVNVTNMALSTEGKSKGSAIVRIVAGALTGVFGFANLLSSGIQMLVMGSQGGMRIAAIIVSALISAVGSFLVGFGVAKLNLLERAKRYAQIAGGRMYADISQIAAATGSNAADVLKDLKKILKKGYYRQGYLDADEKTLMLSDNVYSQYLSTRNHAEFLKREQTEADSAPAKLYPGLTEEESAELTQMIKEGEVAAARLHELNDEIPGEVISAKMDKAEMLLKEIFGAVKEHPEQMKRMHKLMSYYLPTMMKLMEAYAEYDKMSMPGKEILDAKNEIEKTLDTINEAFVQLLNNLFRDSVWDVTTDAEVLKTMLANEGLANSTDE